MDNEEKGKLQCVFEEGYEEGFLNGWDARIVYEQLTKGEDL